MPSEGPRTFGWNVQCGGSSSSCLVLRADLYRGATSAFVACAGSMLSRRWRAGGVGVCVRASLVAMACRGSYAIDAIRHGSWTPRPHHRRLERVALVEVLVALPQYHFPFRVSFELPLFFLVVQPSWSGRTAPCNCS